MVLATFIAACLGQKHESHTIIVALLLLKWQPLLVTLSGAYYRTSSSLLRWIMHRLLLTTCTSWVQSFCLIIVTFFGSEHSLFLFFSPFFFLLRRMIFKISFRKTSTWISSGSTAATKHLSMKRYGGKKTRCSHACQPSISVVSSVTWVWFNDCIGSHFHLSSISATSF